MPAPAALNAAEWARAGSCLVIPFDVFHRIGGVGRYIAISVTIRRIPGQDQQVPTGSHKMNGNDGVIGNPGFTLTEGKMSIPTRVFGHAFMRHITVYSFIAACATIRLCPAETVVAPAPQGEALCRSYTLKVGGKDVPVYACRVSAVPFNQVWPGYQRPLDQTELAGFAYWDMSGGPVRIEIQSKVAVQTVAVRPGNLKIIPTVQGDRIAFDLDRPRQVVVEVNGPHNALHLFGNPPETNAPAKEAPGVLYYGPGVHHTGKITLQSDQTLYLAPGAVVYGCVNATGAKNIRITGRGILDMSPFARGQVGNHALDFRNCSGIVIDGIIMRDPNAWCCALYGCRDAVINNVKLVGLWRYNSDGIDICNSQDVKVSDCFVRSFDDSLVIKGNVFPNLPVRNIRFSRCTLWCDWGVAMKIGTETFASEIAGVFFEDCDIIYATHVALGITPRDRAPIHDIRFENIRVEMDERYMKPRLQQRKGELYDEQPGNYLPQLMTITITERKPKAPVGPVAKVFYKNVAVTAPRMPDSRFYGFDSEHGVTDVSIEGISLNGRPVANAAEAKLSIGRHVSGVEVKNFTDTAR
ncbi:MAG: glycosyl hydrolase family 28 protein [bacterium]|nr:glycosyl hydrolase family 28 protein [bacterium]